MSRIGHMSRSDYVPNWICPEMACTEVVMSETSGASSTEQWRLVPDSKEPNFVNTAVAKLYSHVRISIVNKVAIFYEIVLIPHVCCSFRCTLSLYWQCVYVHARNSCPKRTEWSEQTNTMTNKAYHHVTFLNLYMDVVAPDPTLPLPTWPVSHCNVMFCRCNRRFQHQPMMPSRCSTASSVRTLRRWRSCLTRYNSGQRTALSRRTF